MIDFVLDRARKQPARFDLYRSLRASGRARPPTSRVRCRRDFRETQAPFDADFRCPVQLNSGLINTSGIEDFGSTSSPSTFNGLSADPRPPRRRPPSAAALHRPAARRDRHHSPRASSRSCWRPTRTCDRRPLRSVCLSPARSDRLTNIGKIISLASVNAGKFARPPVSARP